MELCAELYVEVILEYPFGYSIEFCSPYGLEKHGAVWGIFFDKLFCVCIVFFVFYNEF